MRKLTHEELVERQYSRRDQPKVRVVVVLDNLRSAQNVGSIFRICDGAGVEALWLCGITCYPPDAKLTKTALGSQDDVVWHHEADVERVVQRLKNEGFHIVVIEQTDRSIGYDQFVPSSPVCLVVGHEITGVHEKVVAMADSAVDIEMWGKKNSLNAAVAGGIVITEISRKMRAMLPLS
jgi:23S rRNA (guanosine2251-2'-O)-methyltransferase